MRGLMLFALVLLPVSASALRAQWGAGGDPVGSVIEEARAARTQYVYEWRNRADTPGEAYLYCNGVQVGAIDKATGRYLPLILGKWGAACDPPIPHPAIAGDEHFGVDWSKLTGSGHKIRGQTVTKEQAYQAVREGLPNDSTKLRLTAIGTPSERLPVEKDLASPENRDVLDRVLLWSVDKDHWSLRDSSGQSMFVNTGRPTVYLTAADGKVLYRENDYRPGDVGAIRAAIKGYDSQKDPGRASSVGPLNLPNIPPMLWVGLLAAGGVVVGTKLERRSQ